MQNGMNYVLNLRVFLTSKSLAQSQNEGVGEGEGGYLTSYLFIFLCSRIMQQSVKNGPVLKP